MTSGDVFVRALLLGVSVEIGRSVLSGGKVFLSHTSELAKWPDGRSCVQQALDAASEADWIVRDMRYFSAEDRPPAEVCERAVRECSALVAVIGFRYGSLVPGRDISYTELESMPVG